MGKNVLQNSGKFRYVSWASDQRAAVIGETRKPFCAYSIPGTNRSANGKRPNFFERLSQASTAPGTVTQSQPDCGISFKPEKCSKFQALGDFPEPFKPHNFFLFQISAKASPPIPLLVGSNTVSAMAVARAASTALPPFISICKPAWAARGCDVATTFCANTGIR